ncbi:glycyl-radical enzyme activating protein [Orbus sturtevantii]|uniref:glycyl-radical enzyme activating protein n=1 Tax=Orbus sturtevantii TaxID=3074109 RepID=UPI00370CFEA3
MIFNVQRYSTHDGPGIRTVVFLKGCSLGCYWCQNPESRSAQKQVLFDKRLCIKDCQLCVTFCPNAITRLNERIYIDRNKLTSADYETLQHLCPSLAMTVCGEIKSEDDVMEMINKDAAFYQRSGGGVTLSGGEPFMQPTLSQNILQKCKQQGYHTAVETCLHVPWKSIQSSLDFIDLFLADLKHTDMKIFHQWANGSAKRILENFKKLAKVDKKIIIRIPLIQGFNANRNAIKSMIDFIANEIPTNEIHFLPYHTLGINKYNMLDMPYYAPSEPLDDEDLIQYATTYAKLKNLTAILRG